MSTVLISAGDASGDMHGAGLVRALRERRPGTRFVGLGGPRMAGEGVELIARQSALAVGGLVELFGSAGRIVSTWRSMVAALVRIQPDLIVLIDSGGFNLPFARRARRAGSAPILYYVPPQVWAWRRGRVRKLARRVDRLALIFPFEPEVYAGTELHVDFVGHPLVEDLAPIRGLSRDAARGKLELSPDSPLIAIFPGSRRNEVAYQLPVQLEAARVLHGRRPEVDFAIGVAPSIEAGVVERLVVAAHLPGSLRVDLRVDCTPELIRASDAVLAKPGTVTVESALLERPMVIVGRTNPVTAVVLRHAVRVASFSMPNLIAGEDIVPEFLQDEALPEDVAAALVGLLDGPARMEQLEALREVARRLGGRGAANRAAQVAEDMLGLAAR